MAYCNQLGPLLPNYLFNLEVNYPLSSSDSYSVMTASLLDAVRELRIVDLKAELERRELNRSGSKAVLITRLHAELEKEGMKPDEVKKLRIEQTVQDEQKRENTEEVQHEVEVRPEDSVSQQGSRTSRRSNRRSVADSVQSAAGEELMRSAARKAGLLAKMEALKDQADEEMKLQSMIRELELKKQQGALMAQLAEEEAQQKVYAQCGGSRVGSVQGALAASPQLQHQVPQTLNAEAPVFEPRVHMKTEDLKKKHEHEHKEEERACVQQEPTAVEPKMMEVLLQATEKAQLPPAEVVKFGGDPAEFFSFIRSFDSRIGTKHISNQDKLSYLQQCTEGQPHEIVRGCLLMPPEKGYQEARRLLHKRYGNEDTVSGTYINKLLSWPTIKADDIQGLQNLAVAMMVAESVMSNMIVGFRETDHPRTLRKLVEKLPFHLHDRWRRLADGALENERRRVTFTDLVKFVDKEARVVANPLYGRQKMDARRTNSGSKESQRPKKYGLATSVQVVVAGCLLQDIWSSEAYGLWIWFLGQYLCRLHERVLSVSFYAIIV